MARKRFTDFSSSTAVTLHSFLVTAALLPLLSTPLWAIPSPDLVVNFVASAAQVLGLLTVAAGSFAYSGAKRRSTRGQAAPARRWPFHVCLVLLLVSVSANVLQHFAAVDEKNQRLQTNLWRSSTEAGKKVGDINLKTLSVSEQEKRPEAIRTEDLALWMQEGRPLNLIDVREPEEVEMGYIAGAWHRRYPDLDKDRTGLIVEGKETVLLCESGNRSGELCGKFLADKLPCRFVIGGYEKWVAEGRPLAEAKERTGSEIRDIADYPNKHVLLDTPEVMELLEREKAIFVDVRYPGDFDQGHLPDAFNITLRKMLKEEIEPALRSLPKRPVIAPCYDKRSSFYALILGLRLHRLGYDYRGRYTVPHEFAEKVSDKAWAAQWKEAQEGKTFFGMLSQPLSGILGWAERLTGSLVWAIVLVVVLLRILVLPLSVKADRDQIVQRRLAPSIRELKRGLSSDPQRLSRATMALYRKSRLTLGRNLAGTIVQVLLFILFFTVVGTAGQSSNEALIWAPSLANPDPYYVLPSIVGLLIFIFLCWNAEKRTPLRIAGHVACGLLLFGITYELRTAVNFYLAVNLSLLILQSRLVRWRIAWKEAEASKGSPKPAEPATLLPPTGIVPLRQAHLTPGTGNKAIRLGRMLELGIPVPDGFVVTDHALSREGESLQLTEDEKRQVVKLWRAIGAEKVAVRSSGLNEDGANKSYAGVFESVLNVTEDRFLHALAEVHASLQASRVAAYSGEAKERGGIVVQKMVPAEFAGVLFTEHPGSTGCMLVELVKGLGDALVSGAATPRSFRYGRYSGRLLEAHEPPMDLRPLLELGRKVEEAFGRPQDIEWAYAEGKFFLLQARDITTSSSNGGDSDSLIQVERRRLLVLAEKSISAAREEGLDIKCEDDPVIFVQNELSELLPRPTPMSLSFMDSLWGPGGSTDLACRSLGIPFDVAESGPPMVTTIYGSLYISQIEARRRLRRGPGATASFKLARAAESLEQEMRSFFTGFLKEVRLLEALDLKQLSLDELRELLGIWSRRFITETYVQAERINVAADFYVKVAKKEIEKRQLDPSIYLGRLSGTVVHEAMSILPAIQTGERRVEDFLAVFGHRAPTDYELSQPRYAESPQVVLEMASRAQGTKSRDPELPPPEESRDKVFLLAVDRARRFQVLKEEAKHHSLRELALLRKVLVEIGERLELGNDIFYLTLEEAQSLTAREKLNDAVDLIDDRMHAAEAFKEFRSLPTELRMTHLEAATKDEPAARAAHSHLRGTRVAGGKDVQGRVRVVAEPSDINSFRKGEILVARFTDPTWTPLFPLASGVITEVGGWLSHAAIVAREYNVTCIVGAAGALSSLATGDIVELKADGSISKVAVLAPTRAPRVRRSESISLVFQGRIVEAMLMDISATGALVDAPLEIQAGQSVHIQIPLHGEAVQGEIVRREGAKSYGIRFSKPIPHLPQDGGGPVKN